ncbi:MAG TPA: alpha/beta hydrolase [Acidobacteriaceae bacterium]|jgi:acetyl esterase/lipase
MNRSSLAALLLFAAPLVAQTPAAAPSRPAATITAPPAGFAQSIVLWPEGAPGAQGTTEGDVPKLFTYPTAGAGPHNAVIVMPGGGYTHEVMEQEGAYEARWLAAHGVAAFVLEYRLSPAYMYPAQMQDASRAIRYVRSHAADLGVKADAIGIWGFSAGGHLSAYMATIHKAGDPAAKDPIDRVSDRPDFAILSYAPASMDLYARMGIAPLKTLIGDHPTQAQIDAVDPVKHVSADTSPCFIYSTTGDKTVDSRNAAEFYIALKAAGVPVELHVFELGQHGTHMGDDAKSPPELKVNPTLVANWMQLHGWMPVDSH